MSRTKERQHKIYDYIKTPREQTLTKEEVIAWAMITLSCTRRYASETIKAFVTLKKIKEIKQDKVIYLA